MRQSIITNQARGVLLVFLACSQPAAGGATDVHHHWKRHTIATTVPRSFAVSLSIGDLNGDGRMDVLLVEGGRSHSSSDAFCWWQSPADPKTGPWPRFSITPTTLKPRWCQASETCDLDHDGDGDAVTVSAHAERTVHIAINPLKDGGDVHRPWKIVIIADGGGECERIVCRDIDRDGWEDIVYILGEYNARKGETSRVHVLFNPATGDCTQGWTTVNIGDAWETAHREKNGHGVMVADIDRDGDPDIFSASGAHRRAGVIFWYENPGDNPRTTPWRRHKISTDVRINYGALQIDDLDRDGWIDLIATEAHGRDCDGVKSGCPGDIYWFRNPRTSSKTWRRQTIGRQNFPHEVHLIDVDGDGRNELWAPDGAFIKTDGPYVARNGILYFKQSSDPRAAWESYRVADHPETGRQCRPFDVDGDGDLDVISTGDHVSGSGLGYGAGGTVSLVWWENRTPRVRAADPR